ncbi:MAG: hypothetical protein RIC18_07525 [Hoeflea sp.]|uniref:hypothetical protein n=1 Tax=Hoeflea sp. TaxID=1940281 RepID=UPI0032EA9AF4
MQADFLLNPELRKGKPAEMGGRDFLSTRLGQALKPLSMTLKRRVPERFSENAIEAWLAVRNFFCRP